MNEASANHEVLAKNGRTGRWPPAVARRGRGWRAAASLAAAGAALLWLEPALAKTAGELGTIWAGYGEPLGKAVSALCYPAGMAAGATSLYKLKANRDNPQHHTVGPVFGWAVVCAGLLFLPQTFKNAGDTIWGSGATVNQAAGTTTIAN
jgi:hypothetical protein